jgi:hypothetical protein
MTATAALAATVSWGHAIDVPGLRARNTGGYAQTTSISCAGAHTCAAGGEYFSDTGYYHAFVVDETNGAWGKAVEAPGTAALNFYHAQVSSISCASAGNCAAGGYYTDVNLAQQAFLMNETKGVWGNATQVPGVHTLEQNNWSYVTSISCATVGNCAAGGVYSGSGDYQVFVVNEKNGVWGKATEVPGTAILNSSGYAELNSISCGSAGNCSAGGSYRDGSGRDQAFVVSSKSGVWGKAKEVPGTAVLNTGKLAQVNSVSCAGAKFCAAGGIYTDSSGAEQAFVVSGKIDTTGKWVWSKAIRVPGTTVSQFSHLASIWCSGAASCVAGGDYANADGDEAFVVNMTSGTWGKAKEVPDAAALGGGASLVTAISCASAGNCAATGSLGASPGVFVVAETNGVWGNATELPGLADLGSYTAPQPSVISCAKTIGTCAVGGIYAHNSDGTYQAFVTSP